MTDDQRACASATETGRTVGRGELGPAGASEDERLAELLREVATLQLALSSLTPEDAAAGDAMAAIPAATEPADAVDAIVRLSGTCQRVGMLIELDGAELRGGERATGTYGGHPQLSVPDRGATA